jgi:hypothetical protein
VDGALTCIAPIRPLQLCADGDYQPSLGALGVPLIMVPDNEIHCYPHVSKIRALTQYDAWAPFVIISIVPRA